MKQNFMRRIWPLINFSEEATRSMGLDPKKSIFSNLSKGFKFKKEEGVYVYTKHDKSGLPRALRRVASQKKHSKYKTVINRMKRRGVKIPDVYFTKPRAVQLSGKTQAR